VLIKKVSCGINLLTICIVLQSYSA